MRELCALISVACVLLGEILCTWNYNNLFTWTNLVFTSGECGCSNKLSQVMGQIYKWYHRLIVRSNNCLCFSLCHAWLFVHNLLITVSIRPESSDKRTPFVFPLCSQILIMLMNLGRQTLWAHTVINKLSSELNWGFQSQLQYVQFSESKQNKKVVRSPGIHYIWQMKCYLIALGSGKALRFMRQWSGDGVISEQCVFSGSLRYGTPHT